MIRVSGVASYRVDFTVDLNMTEEEFDALSYRRQQQVIDDRIKDFSSLELDSLDVDELEELSNDQTKS